MGGFGGAKVCSSWMVTKETSESYEDLEMVEKKPILKGRR